MSTKTPGVTVPAEATTVTSEAPVIPGRADVLKEFAALAMGTPPEEKVAAAEADGEKTSVLSQDKAVVAETPEEQATREAAEATAASELAARAEAAGVTVEEQQAAEAAAAAEAGKAGQPEDHLAEDEELKAALPPETQERINKRIGKEVAKTKAEREAREALEAQLAEANQRLAEKVVALPSRLPLGNVNDLAGLQAEKTKAEQAIDQCDDLILALDDDPASVESVLKEAKVELPEFTPSAMKRYLAQVKANANKTLRTAIPQRAQYLQAVGKFSGDALTVLPELKDPKHPRTASFQKILASVPGLKDNPWWPMAAAVQVLGLEKLAEMQKAKAAPVVPAKKREVPVSIPAPKAQPAPVARAKAAEVDGETATKALNGDKNARRQIIQSLVPKF